MKQVIHRNRDEAYEAVKNCSENVGAADRELLVVNEIFDAGPNVALILTRVTGKSLDYRTFLYRTDGAE